MKKRRGEKKTRDMWKEEGEVIKSKEKDAVEEKSKAFLLFSEHDRRV